MELTPGTVIERYTVDTVLGEGGMAVVYRVRHNQLGTMHALKVLSITSRSVRERLVQEGRVQAQLRHPNIVSVTDVVDIGGNPGLVMEYVRGPDLDALLARQRLSLDQADALAQDIVGAVVAAHRQNLVHRDLKPANVILLITPEGLVPKITDFGLAKLLDEGGPSKTRTGATMGTPHYMSPEQIRDAKNVGPETDVFSLGAILYELVCGRRAFGGADLFEILKAAAEGRYTPPRELVPDLPERMDRAIIGALQVDLALRIPTAERLLAVWRGEAVTGELSVPVPESRGPWTEDIMAEAMSLSGGDLDTSRPPSDPTFPSLTPAPPGSEAPATFDGSVEPVSDPAAPAPAPVRPAVPPVPSPPTPEEDAAPPRRGWLLGLLAAGGGLSLVGLVAVLATALAATLWLLWPSPPAPAPEAPTVAHPVEAPASGEEPTDATPAPAPARPSPRPAAAPAPTEVAPAEETPEEPAEEAIAEAEVVEEADAGPETEAEDPDVRSEEESAEAAPALVVPPSMDPAHTPKGARRLTALEGLERDPDATALIGHIMKNDPDPEVRKKAWRMVRARLRAGTGSRAEHEQLHLWVIDHGTPPLRREALMAMARNGSQLGPIREACHADQVEARALGLRAVKALVNNQPGRRGEAMALLEERQALETDPALLLAIQELMDANP